MYKITIYFIVCMFFYTCAFSQDTSKIISRYRIIESWHDGQDLSSFEQKRKGIIYIHYNKDSKLYLSNISISSGTYSTGLLTLLKNETTYIKTKRRLKIKKMYNWSFTNSYNKTKGIAKIDLIEEESNYGKIFVMAIFLKDNKKIVYKGFKIDEINNFVIPETIL